MTLRNDFLVDFPPPVITLMFNSSCISYLIQYHVDIRCISLVNLLTRQRRLRGRDVVAQNIMQRNHLQTSLLRDYVICERDPLYINSHTWRERVVAQLNCLLKQYSPVPRARS